MKPLKFIIMKKGEWRKVSVLFFSPNLNAADLKLMLVALVKEPSIIRRP